jgi:hypothetical protein
MTIPNIIGLFYLYPVPIVCIIKKKFIMILVCDTKLTYLLPEILADNVYKFIGL